MRRTIPAILLGVLLGVCPMLMGPTGGMPSRPRFAAIGVGTSVTGSGFVRMSSTAPDLQFNESDAPLNEKAWSMGADSGGTMRGVAYLDNFGGGGTTWLAVDRTGTTIDSVALTATAITANGVAITPTSSSFSGTLNGMSAGGTGTFFYQTVGNTATVYLKTAVTGTSNTTGMSLSGMPVAIRPGNPKICMTLVTNSGADVAGLINLARSGPDTSDAAVGVSYSGFTASGTKGLPAGFSCSYAIN